MVTQERKRVNIGKANPPPASEAAFTELAIAHEYARDVQCDPWQFAVEISRLKDLGLSVNDLRWLVEKGYLTHAREVTQRSDAARMFVAASNTAFSQETRFLLTDAGLSHAGGCHHGPTLLRFEGRAAAAETSGACLPRWDRNNGTLYVGSQIVKRFKRASPNQEIVLSTFEEAGWPDRIEDPLPPTHDVAPKQRLHDTIKWLNRDHDVRLLGFSGDGTGEGVRWRILLPATLPISAHALERQPRAA